MESKTNVVSTEVKDSEFITEVVDLFADLGEIGIDSCLNDGILKEIPLVKTAISLWKTSQLFQDRQNLRKLWLFIQEVNNGTVCDEQRQTSITTLHAFKEQRQKHMEYLLIIIDRYIHYKQVQFLARIYLSFLNMKITWPDVCKYAETVDRMLPGDYEVLKAGGKPDVHFSDVDDCLLRLVAMGLMVTHPNGVIDHGDGHVELPSGDNQNYVLTPFGKTLLSIIE